MSGSVPIRPGLQSARALSLRHERVSVASGDRPIAKKRTVAITLLTTAITSSIYCLFRNELALPWRSGRRPCVIAYRRAI
jgi:hypothetical protein